MAITSFIQSGAINYIDTQYVDAIPVPTFAPFPAPSTVANTLPANPALPVAGALAVGGGAALASTWNSTVTAATAAAAVVGPAAFPIPAGVANSLNSLVQGTATVGASLRFGVTATPGVTVTNPTATSVQAVSAWGTLTITNTLTGEYTFLASPTGMALMDATSAVNNQITAMPFTVTVTEVDNATNLAIGTTFSQNLNIQTIQTPSLGTMTESAGDDALVSSGLIPGIINGLAGNDTITGFSGAAVVSGGETLIGGAGNDTFIITSNFTPALPGALPTTASGTFLQEAPDGGTDTIELSSTSLFPTYTLADNFENLTNKNAFVGAALFGNALNNVITASNFGNALNGGLGADTMIGGAGSDTFTVDNAGDVVTEASATGGTDTVNSTVSFTLGANIENLNLLLVPGAGASQDIGGFGNDLNNSIVGNAGNNLINGGAGADTMAGGAGNDTYYVDNAGDVVTEAVGGGTDAIWSTAASYTVTAGAEIENITIWGAGVSATGNAFAQTITGSDLANTIGGGTNTAVGGVTPGDTLIGGNGNDTYLIRNIADVITETGTGGWDVAQVFTTDYTLSANVEVLQMDTSAASVALNGTGSAGNNFLLGNANNNLLDGRAGADVMAGYAGNDTYIVDNIGDVVVEAANEGTDTVISSLSSFILSTNFENLTLATGISGALGGFGNAADNVITGNEFDNYMNGLGGNDTLVGGNGNDTYYVSASNTVITELAGGGTDIIYSTSTNFDMSVQAGNVENMVLWGAGVNAVGNASNNIMFGNDAVNSLFGGAGTDILVGGRGVDHLNLTETTPVTDTVFVSVGDSLTTAYDVVTGFALGVSTTTPVAADKLDLATTTIAANVTNAVGTAAGAIVGHSIASGIISFNGAGNALIPLNNLALQDAINYVQTNITGGATVAFIAVTNDTFVFQDGGVDANDTLVNLVGVQANSLNTTGLAATAGAGAVWIA